MKNQRKNSEARSLGFFRFAIVALTLAALACCFTLFASAQQAPVIGTDDVLVDLPYENGIPYKVYDGTDTAPVTLSPAAQAALDAVIDPADADLVKIQWSAKYNSADVATAKNILVTFEAVTLQNTDAARAALAKYEPLVPVDMVLSAAIAPQVLNWNGTATAETVYQMATSQYSVKVTQLPELNMTGAPAIVTTDVVAQISGVTAPTAPATYETTVQIALDSQNYVAAPLKVAVTVKPIEIVKIEWEKFNEYAQYTFQWGDANVNDIRATGYDANNNAYPMSVTFPAGYGAASATGYQVTAVPTAGTVLSANVTAAQTVTINKKVYTVSMSGGSFKGNADFQAIPTVYSLVVEGDLPADVRALIQYANNNQSAYGTYEVTATLPTSENYEFRDASGAVVTTLKATMYINKPYVAASNADLPYQVILYGQNGFAGNITATLTIPEELNAKAISAFKIYKAYTVAINGAAGEAFSIIIPIADTLYNERCDLLTVNDLYLYDAATGTMVAVNEKSGYTVTLGEGYYQIEGVAGDGSYTFVLAPVYNAPFWTSAWGIALIVLLVIALIALLILVGLYLRRVRTDEENEAVVVDEGEVTEAVAAEVEDKVDVDESIDAELEQIAESIEPEEEAEAADAEAVENAVDESMQELLNESADLTGAVVLDEEDTLTPEELRAVVDAIVYDAMNATMDLPELAVEETAEEVTEEVAEEVAEETVEEITEEVAEEIAEEVAEEATEEVAEEIAVDEVAAEETEEMSVCAVVADSVAVAFEMVTVDGVTPAAKEGTTLETITAAVDAASDANVPANWTVGLARTIEEAVVDELAARLLVVEAVETIAEVEDVDDDNDEDEDDSFAGFGSMPLDFIDAIAEAEKYAEMLEQERRGEVQLVVRYRRSFQSRLSQSQGNVQEYYNVLKNALLSYKGVKNRISWNYEAFNRGRVHVAKINVKTKTIYLYLALDPEELMDTKYGIVDMSSKKKYATVPVLMKIKGERKFKYALELIAKLCGENLELPALEIEDTDYTVPYQTTEELVQAGFVKKLVAAIPVVAFTEEAPAAEEPTPVSTAAEEQEVTFVAPTDAPAVAAAAEEVAQETAEENKEV